MIVVGGGLIINMGLNLWWEVGGGFLVYVIVKVGVYGLICIMVCDFGVYCICVNMVVFGWIMIEC